MKKSEWSEAEKACVSIYKHNQRETLASHGMPKAYGIGRKLLAELEPDVKPVFPDKVGFVLLCDGHTDIPNFINKYTSLQGNTFETRLLAEEESTRREAQTRVREKINIANKGYNQFKVEGDNYYFEFNYRGNCIDVEDASLFQSESGWEYIRTREAANNLLKDKEFVADWLKMKGIKE
jgi:hypothetical protein